jgi:hypothetical protein
MPMRHEKSKGINSLDCNKAMKKNSKPVSGIKAAKQLREQREQDYSPIYKALGVEFRSDHNSAHEVRARECPFCGKDKFYVNIRTGQYDCKSGECLQSGNHYTFLNWQHAQLLEMTTAEDYLALKAKRGIASQTLKVHGLAFDQRYDRWQIPFRNAKGNIVTLQFYYPNRAKPNKMNLVGLSKALYGFEKLMDDTSKSKHVLVCEGVFDAIAIDYNIGSNRQKYVVVASPGVDFKAEWAEHFKGRKVRLLFDNDEAGRNGSEKVGKLLSNAASEVKVLKWPSDASDKDVNELLKRDGHIKIVGWTDRHCYELNQDDKLIVYHGEPVAIDERPIDWIWPKHLRCGSYCSFSGRMGTFKSTVAIEIAARFTTGRPMPMEQSTGMPAGTVLFIFAEDDRDTVDRKFKWAGGDTSKWFTMPAHIEGDEPLNVIEQLPAIQRLIRRHSIRLVILDGQNSLVGAPNIKTDMLARSNVTNPLHQFSQRENICMIGIRNEDLNDRALGPQSMGDIGRCVMRAVELEPHFDPPYCELIFVKVSDTARKNYPPIPYSVNDHGGSHSEILWGEKPEQGLADSLERSAAKGRAK